jgi:sec-independent protein translocase protein TatA
MFRNGLEPWHVLLVIAVVVLLFGAKRLPEMARSIGRSLRILKAETAALREDGTQDAESGEDEPGRPPAPR